MSPLDAAVLRRKLAVIARNLEDLGPIAALSLEEYRADRFRLKGSERLLQELIEAAADLNLHLLRSAGEPYPPDYFQSFIGLGRLGVIPSSLAERLAPSAGLRTHLVHGYEEIDDRTCSRRSAKPGASSPRTSAPWSNTSMRRAELRHRKSQPDARLTRRTAEPAKAIETARC